MEYLLHQLLSKSASLYPINEAVRMGNDALSYEQLDRISNQVARALRSAGVKRGDRVGIYVHKSLASVIGVFGVMKAGAAYVPLDPNAPAKRLAYITNDCDVKVVLTSSAKIQALSEFFEKECSIGKVMLMDAMAENVSGLPDRIELIPWESIKSEDEGEMPWLGSIDADLAYILYTSGSTGVPKGVMIAHRTILTFVNWCCEEFQMTEKDRVTSHAPLHFDLSTFDLYATVKAGGTIVLVGETLSALPTKLAALLQNERITITYLVPSILSFMVNYGKLGANDFSALRTVLFAGEVFPIKFLRRLVAAIPHASYYNLYGPTETNVCTYYQVNSTDLEDDRTQAVPIGQAPENMEVFAVDDQGELITECGVEGELWVRGSCVAQGYWGDKNKTAEVFVQNPRNPLYRDVSYRTGDIVELAPDRRNWIYVGRRDHMIKSRGYRIELGEIENALYGHSDVKEAAVIAIPDELLGNRIWAFVAVTAGCCVTPNELGAFCAERVPKYMVPEQIELCDSLPKTSSGKIDRPVLLTRV